MKHSYPGNVSQAVTILPRLEHSRGMLSDIITRLDPEVARLRASNTSLLRAGNGSDPAILAALGLERTVCFSLETLRRVRARMASVSGIRGLSKCLPVVIPAVRTVSAQLFDVLPECSRRLSELSVHLGSILLDSAILATAKFDFGRSNSESASFLDKVKLMTDSKIDDQYHNLGLLQG